MATKEPRLYWRMPIGWEFYEDCMKTDLSLVYNVHLTNCCKPLHHGCKTYPILEISFLRGICLLSCWHLLIPIARKWSE